MEILAYTIDDLYPIMQDLNQWAEIACTALGLLLGMETLHLIIWAKNQKKFW